MRTLFGVLSLLIAFVIVAMLAKKQIGTPAGAASQQQSQQIERQIKQTVEETLQQARPMPDDK